MDLFVGICILFYVASTSGAPRVIGGKNATGGTYPHMVSLREYGHFCGGSIINKRWILTAAHCLVGKEDTSITVVAGTVLLRGGTEQVYQSEYVVAHESFHNPPFSNDIGLIRVSRDIEFNDRVKQISLPRTDVYKAGIPVVISGWGSTELGGASPNHLQEISLKIFGQDTCKDKMRKIANITNHHICTFTKYGEGVCHGDSGSPLVADGVQVGIASFVDPCAVGNPDVFTRVYTFLDWIKAEQVKFKTD